MSPIRVALIVLKGPAPILAENASTKQEGEIRNKAHRKPVTPKNTKEDTQNFFSSPTDR
jgi:hypothetical protein